MGESNGKGGRRWREREEYHIVFHYIMDTETSNKTYLTIGSEGIRSVSRQRERGDTMTTEGRKGEIINLSRHRPETKTHGGQRVRL